MIQYLPLRSGLCVLEYGCGEGVLFEQLNGWAGTLYGVDRRLPGTRHAGHAALSDGRLPFAGETFDAVLGQHVLRAGTAADPGAAVLGALDATAVLLELARVLRPGGRLILWERVGDIQRWTEDVRGRMEGIRGWTESVRGWTENVRGPIEGIRGRSCGPSGLEGLALLGQSAGLTLVDREPFDRLAYPAAWCMDKVPWLRRSHLGMTLLQGMFALDTWLAHCGAASWHMISVWEKGYV